MDIVEYVEETYGIELLEYQKVCLRALYDEYKNSGKLVYIPITSRRSLIACCQYAQYLKQNNLPICKELFPSGKTLNSNNKMPVMRQEC